MHDRKPGEKPDMRLLQEAETTLLSEGQEEGIFGDQRRFPVAQSQWPHLSDPHKNEAYDNSDGERKTESGSGQSGEGEDRERAQESSNGRGHVQARGR